MASEITCIVRAPAGGQGEIEAVGGSGWVQDTATVLGQIAEGREYFIRLGSARISVTLSEDASCPLRTDPAETEENALLRLPDCHRAVGHSNGAPGDHRDR